MNDKSTENSAVIVVVGSLHYDIMIDAPDRPRKGETVIGSHWNPKFGGKGGNQAIAAAKTGIETRFVGSVGTDDFSTYMLCGLEEANISTEHIFRNPTLGTGMSVAIMDAEGDYGAVIVSGANTSIDTATFEKQGFWCGVNVLILQNEIPTSINLEAARAAKNAGVQVCLNAAPTKELPQSLLELVDILIVNAIEAEDLCNIKVSNLEAAKRAANALSGKVGTVIVTAGGDGVAIASEDTKFAMEAIPVELVSTHGAGDMFVGTLCAELASKTGLHKAVETANRAAAIHVSKPN